MLSKSIIKDMYKNSVIKAIGETPLVRLSNIEKHFNLPYAIDIMPLIEVHEDLKGTIFPRLGMLTLFNEVNKKEMQEERGYQKKLESDNKWKKHMIF